MKPISILFLTHHPAPEAGTFSRIQQFLPHLEAAGFKCTVRPFYSRELSTLLHRNGAYCQKILLATASTYRRLLDLPEARNFDLVYVHREVYPFGTPWPERLLHALNRRVIFSFDDAIYVGHASLNGLTDKWLYRVKYGPGVNWVIEHSLHVIAGNRFLAAHAEKFNRRVSIVPTVVDTDQFCPPSQRHSAILRIGWMGSPSTSQYLHSLVPVFNELSRRYQNIEFLIHGDAKFPSFPNAVIKDYRLGFGPQDLWSIDIGIMPLPDNEWTRGKCAFKAIQYMAVGVPTVASPVGMVDELIADGETGFFAESPSEWFTKLSLLIEREDLRRRLGEEGRKKVVRDFSLQAWAPRFSQMLRGIHQGLHVGEPRC